MACLTMCLTLNRPRCRTETVSGRQPANGNRTFGIARTVIALTPSLIRTPSSVAALTRLPSLPPHPHCAIANPDWSVGCWADSPESTAFCPCARHPPQQAIDPLLRSPLSQAPTGNHGAQFRVHSCEGPGTHGMVVGFAAYYSAQTVPAQPLPGGRDSAQNQECAPIVSIQREGT